LVCHQNTSSFFGGIQTVGSQRASELCAQVLAVHCVKTFGHWKVEKSSSSQSQYFPDEKPILVTDVECSRSADTTRGLGECGGIALRKVETLCVRLGVHEWGSSMGEPAIS
jgi:hypothetical protein